MLVLNRKIGQRIRIGDDIIVSVNGYDRGYVKVGVTAPRDVAVHREEVWIEIQRAANDGRESA